MEPRVAAFTDTYLPTINGVTYTVRSWREYWMDRGGRMDVVYPGARDHAPDEREYPVRSLQFPFYDGYRLGVPQIPDAVDDADVVHAHTPFGVGLGGLRLARKTGSPFVASYHTPTSEYANYLAPTRSVATRLRYLSERYERWFFDRAETVIVPSRRTREHVIGLGIDAPVTVVPNGVDVEQFRPVDPEEWLRSYGLDGERPLVGYTGRHGYEKRLHDLVDAVADMDVTLVLAGDGPARSELEERAAERGVEARFLGFLDREELPAFYSGLDVFAFPSPVETQGLVALEANACGTPTVGVDAGALSETIEEGTTGFRYQPGDIDGFRAALERALDDRDRLSERCLDRREEHSVDRAIDTVTTVYQQLL